MGLLKAKAGDIARRGQSGLQPWFDAASWVLWSVFVAEFVVRAVIAPDNDRKIAAALGVFDDRPRALDPDARGGDGAWMVQRVQQLAVIGGDDVWTRAV